VTSTQEYKTLIGKPQEKRSQRKHGSGCEWEDNIKMNVKAMVYEGGD